MVRPHRHTTGCAWALLSSSPCTSVEIQAGRAAAAQPWGAQPSSHEGLQGTRPLTDSWKKKQKRLTDFAFPPSPSILYSLPSSPAFCWSSTWNQNPRICRSSDPPQQKLQQPVPSS